MSKLPNTDGGAVALYWDFENIHAALFESKHGEGSYSKGDCRYKPQEALINLQAILEVASSFGTVAINRAYGNWQYFGRYRDQLLQGAVELIQLFPPGVAGKNGADIKLCLDAFEDVSRFEHLDTVVVVGGDSDFMPVAQKIKSRGKRLVGIGARRATNKHWAKCCHEFRYYESLLADDAPADRAAEAPEMPAEVSAAQRSKETVRRALKLLTENLGDPWVDKARLLPMVKRLDPTFDPKENGFSSFAGFLKPLTGGLIEVRKGRFDQQLRLREPMARRAAEAAESQGKPAIFPGMSEVISGSIRSVRGGLADADQ